MLLDRVMETLLLDVLEANKTLIRLDVRHNPINEKLRSDIDAIVQKNYISVKRERRKKLEEYLANENRSIVF